MDKFQKLEDSFDVMTGAKPYQVGKGIPPQTKAIVTNKPYTSTIKADDSWVPYMRGKCIEKYANTWEGQKEYIKYGAWLAEPRTKSIFDGEKLFVRQTGDSLIATYDSGNVSNNTLHSIYPIKQDTVSLIYLLGIINSSLLNWYYQIAHYLEVSKPMAEVKGTFLKRLPIAKTQVTEVEAMVKELMILCQKRFDTKNKFVGFIQSAYEPKAITNQIENFETISFKELCIELKKQKVCLSGTDKLELLSLFNSKKEEVLTLSSQISSIQRKLDETVFSIYGLNQEEIEYIKKEISK